MIIYFTGTGNSEFVAKYLAKHLEDEAVNVAQFIREKEYGDFNSDKPLVFVSPVYVSAPPLVFMDFVEKSHFKGNKKAYFILTCKGGMGASAYYWKEVARKKRFDYMGCESIIMPQNYLVFFKTKDQKDTIDLVRSSKESMARIALRVSATRAISMGGPKKWEISSTKAVLKPYYDLFIKADDFRTTDCCVSCGLCEKVCPLKNIEMVDGKPVWHSNCTHCMACINRCPKQAIEYGKKTIGKPRYTCIPYKG